MYSGGVGLSRCAFEVGGGTAAGMLRGGAVTGGALVGCGIGDGASCCLAVLVSTGGWVTTGPAGSERGTSGGGSLDLAGTTGG